MRYNKIQIEFSPELRKHYADKILDLANIGVGALVFGQFLSEQPYSWYATFAGLGLIFLGYFVSYLVYPSEEGSDNHEPK